MIWLSELYSIVLQEDIITLYHRERILVARAPVERVT